MDQKGREILWHAGAAVRTDCRKKKRITNILKSVSLSWSLNFLRISSSQLHHRRSPSAFFFSRALKRFHVRQFFKDRFDRTPEGPRAFAVDDPHPEDTALSAFLKIPGHKVLHVCGVEGVQIEDAVDGLFDRAVGIH